MSSDRWSRSTLNHSEIEDEIVATLTAARIALGMSRSALGRRLGVSRTAIYNWEQRFYFCDRLSKVIEWGRAVGRRVIIKIE